MIISKPYSLLYSSILCLFFIAGCNSFSDKDEQQDNNNTAEQAPAVLYPQLESRYHLGDTIMVKLELVKNYKPDSVQFLLDGLRMVNAKSDLAVTLFTDNKTLGKHTISAVLFLSGKSTTYITNFYLLAKVPPITYDYRILNVYPHDTTAFTEGLIYSDGYLYESTGQYGKSELRKVELKTGTVLKRITLDKQYFGEGLTQFKRNFIQLTWKENTGFVYDANFSLVKTFNQDNREGWGLCNDSNYLLQSDGSHKIYFLNTETYREERHIEVYDNQLPVRRINELEYVEGSIYANLWETNTIAIINPINGQLTATINVSDILNMYEKRPSLDVLNGIAYDTKGKRLFITGKNWPKLFEIKIVPKS